MTRKTDERRNGSWGRYLVLLLAALLMGLLLWVWQSPDLGALKLWAEETASHPLTMLAVMLVMAVTLALGLPGSIGLWLIAPFHHPVIAVPMLIVGSVGGALGAYWLAEHFRRRIKPGKMTLRMMRLMQRRGDVLTQCALRVLPGFPHSVINYAAGLARLPLAPFVVAAVLGLGAKWSVYASAIHGALEAVERGEGLSPEVVLPLALLTLLLLLGAWVRRRIEARQELG